ncbi:hemolysin III [Cryobacterium psychrotolerans]|uniref:Hemolysin III n=1 Tax=Cryobacterium psychrotolerans TaxID=386301 RepID=A0A1G8XLH2_9MICO|nr:MULTISPECIES: hemolysin III family protein [Cryobacterium]TFD44959.1 hemolysin III family protein [Cryobacterium sp. TMT1-2-1]TFD82879.1 hemolysin III family protein [Cryobacterium psychrotolerans]SDJ91004.1 hemolysin III [Cryobacterium psychrotolerans]
MAAEHSKDAQHRDGAGLPDDAEKDAEQEIANLPLLEEDEPRPEDLRPTWRGWIHAGTFPVTIVAGIILLVLAEGPAATWSSAVFVATSMLLFGNSALYHRFDWQPRTKVILKRIDHANIFLLIAGSYTPITVLSLPPEKATLLLWLVWSGAILGIAFRVFWITAPRWLYVPLYLLLGYGALIFIGDFFRADPVMMTLILVGGIFYSIGAVVYGLKKPNPVPGVFGFHEIFHTLTVLAFLCHWVAIVMIATHPLYP